MSNEQIIESIRGGQHAKALNMLYDNFPAFRNAFVKSGGKKSEAEDVFQDALLIFIEKVSNAEFVLTCSIHTFLFGICRNLSLEHFRKKNNNAFLELTLGETENDTTAKVVSDESVSNFLERESKYKALDKILINVGKKCLEILSLFYVSGLSLTAIAEKLGFNSELSAKTQKYKCLEKAREMADGVLMEQLYQV
jgi:RNA polymerase sigma factor (sigma-70 family)